MTSEKFFSFYGWPWKCIGATCSVPGGHVCPKRRAACCSRKVRRENSAERATQLLLCCLSILRGSEGVATKAAASNFNSQQPLGTPAWALWAFLQHGSHPYTKVHWFIMLRHVPLPRGRFRIHMPAVWVPIWNLPSPRWCFPVLTLSLQWRHILFWSPTCQGFGYSVSALCSVEFS